MHLSADPEIHHVFNDEYCSPSPGHRNPVVFLHGTGTGSQQFIATAQYLRGEGFCPWAIDYGSGHFNLLNAVPGQHGYAELDESLDEIAEFIDDVLTVTGAQKVDLVGHSQGGTLTKAYIQGRDGAAKVDRVVSLGATFHGTTVDDRGELLGSVVDTMPGSSAFAAGAAATQQLVGSETVTALEQLPDTAPDVIYTALYTPSDTVATPNSTSMLESVDGADVVNVDVEAACDITVSHQDMVRSPEVAGLIHWGLTRAEGDHAVGAEQCELKA
ncbi:esterase/lipase family protein [Corynebacterium halotolerans]|uniref:esterase/lipase family protein n=1 Tax=Corynebacterium halotolerans TaxID=225326 RepID=UPI00034B1A4A|nr:alpha/beta fold hydrolase [Corynebacterium halotolerans]